MNPNALGHLNKARQLLERARKLLNFDVDYADDAGRTAYLAGYHAAQAYIVTQAGKAAKTHQGVHVMFAKLTKDKPGFDRSFMTFLSQSYELKSVADYVIDPDAHVTAEEAKEAIATAERFVTLIAELIEAG